MKDDGFSHGQGENLTYCAKHKRFHKLDSECQLCKEEQVSTKGQMDTSEFQQCPACGEMSLFWNRYTQVEECTNPKCKQSAAEKGYKIHEGQAPREEYTSALGDGVKYCYKHRHYYKFDCDACRCEQIALRDKQLDGQHSEPELRQCPVCREKSLYWNQFNRRHECFNPSCKRDFTRREFEELTGEAPLLGEHTQPKGRPSRTLEKCPACRQGMLGWNSAASMYECLNWQCRRRFAEDAVNYAQEGRTRQKHVWISLRLLSTVSIMMFVLLAIAAIGTVFYTIYNQEQMGRPVYIGLILAAAIVAIWNLSTLRNLWIRKWHTVSATKLISSFVLVGLIVCSAAAFTGVTPFSNAKDSITGLGGSFGQGSKSITVPTPQPTPMPTLAPVVTPPRIVVVVTPSPFVTIYTPSTPTLDSSRVWVDSDTYLVGADGSPIILVNNLNARNPSWSQLLDFLRADRTDQICYDERSFTCGDFAEMLHNNAEKAGWRAAFVSIGLTGSGGGHALNAFQTTDLGLVYIDCTGLHCNEPRPIYMDARVDLRVSVGYIPVCIFPELGWVCESTSMGLVTEIEVVQW